jgi:hypothetical protein
MLRIESTFVAKRTERRENVIVERNGQFLVTIGRGKREESTFNA